MPRPAKSARLQLLQKNPNKRNTKELGFNSLLLQLKAEYKVFKEEETNEEK